MQHVIHLPQGTELSKAQALPVLRQQSGGSLEIALKSDKIIISSLEQIKEVLRLVMIKLGLRAQNWPTDEEKHVLIHHIIKEYGGHTLDEIKLAFDMAISQKLEVEVNCYENFSCLYFSNIMNAYRVWAKQKYKAPPAKELPPSNEPPMSDEDFLIMNKGVYETIKKWGLISARCYDILTRRNELVLTEEEKEKIRSTARTHFFSSDNELNREGLRHEEFERHINLNCKRLAVAYHWNDNKEQK